MKFHLLSCFGLLGVCVSQPVNFNDCDIGQYYGDLNGAPQSWSRQELHALIKGTHRHVLPITTKNFAGTDDVWGALMDLDTGASEGTVHLAYTDEDISAEPFGVRYWGKEHLWPLERGIGTVGPDYTDIHNMRPENDLSQVVRGEKFFGACGVLVSEADTPCEEPAQGGGPDTCSCNRLYTPPRNMRGDIARALMYMDLRYDGSDPDTLDLTLTDCPFTRDRDMSYLSQMLQWHEDDPPDDKEILRNQNACRSWQGNRNPFIDYPALARSLYGQPLPLPARGQSLIYPECEAIPTSPPTPTDNTCDMMQPGDIYFFLINSVKPDNVGLFNFVNIPEGFELYVTDNAWTGSQWLTNEGIIKMTAPPGGIDAGEIFGFGEDFPGNEYWVLQEGIFDLSVEGEQVFLFCLSADGSPRPLAGISLNGNFSAPFLPIEQYDAFHSALPESLAQVGSVALEKMPNYVYNGPGTALTNDLLRLALQDKDNWEGSEKNRFGLDGINVNVDSEASVRLPTAIAIVMSLATLLLC